MASARSDTAPRSVCVHVCVYVRMDMCVYVCVYGWVGGGKTDGG